MGERKVLNQYYPPDFDPSKLPRAKRADLNALKVRMMLPMSIRCGTCGTFMSKGTKFNTKKEDVEGESYLGIQVLRFYMRCSACSAEITFKTDPERSSYSVEHGATANWVPWAPGGDGSDAPAGVAAAAAAADRDAGGDGDAMAALEARVAASKRELDLLDAVDELRARAAARANLAPDAALAALASDGAAAAASDRDAVDPDAEDEAVVARMLQARAERVRRLEEEGEAAAAPTAVPPQAPPAAPPLAAPPRPAARPAVVVVKKRAAAGEGDGGAPAAKKAAPDADGGGGGGRPGRPRRWLRVVVVPV